MPASETPFKRFVGVPMSAQYLIWLSSFMIFQVSGPVLPYIFVIFQGYSDPLSPAVSLHGLLNGGK